ncbi:MAG: VWA domain-containing protein [Fulvivirga sp.]|uniref:vWA domain-containing protein n=1 Tax=Fulvivirga sp. TaxID=1931237 RepID=UPI0032EE96B1
MRIILIVILLSIQFPSFCQTSFKGQLTSGDTMNLEILNAYPESFPKVSLLFHAESTEKSPIWNLSKSDLIVKENKESQLIDTLFLQSKNNAINISLILDHSGSMQQSDELLDTIKYPEMARYIYDGFIYTMEGFKYPEGYVAPIDHAKSAISSFNKSFESNKDLINLIGFSSRVDVDFPFTNDFSKIDSVLSTVKADSMTAFYDALLRGIKNLDNTDGLKSIVALTDGLNNHSNSTFEDVLDSAVRKEIPIYVIGLGSVNIDTLSMLANLTGGRFYHTNDPKSLNEVYSEISRTIQSIYELHYTSNNLSHLDSLKEIVLDYNIDSIYVQKAIINKILPESVIQTLQKRKQQSDLKYIYGGLTILVLVTMGGYLYYKAKSS